MKKGTLAEKARNVLRSSYSVEAYTVGDGPIKKVAILMPALVILIGGVVSCVPYTMTPTDETFPASPTPIATEAPTPIPTPSGPFQGDTRTRSADGMVMVYVPAGEFVMGSTDEEVDYALELCNEYRPDCKRGWFADEQPAHIVTLDGFWIDRTEVTNGQYQRCVAAHACEPPEEDSPYVQESHYGDSDFDDHPVILIGWYDAKDYCEWAGGRLLTEAEWEYAARGPEGRIFPWGDELDGTRLNYCDVNCEMHYAGYDSDSFDDGYAYAAPVGSYPDGASWVGALDLAGNVWEWTADWKGEYQPTWQVNPTGPTSGSSKVLRGGGWLFSWYLVRTATRGSDGPDMRLLSNVGFRCAASRAE